MDITQYVNCKQFLIFLRPEAVEVIEVSNVIMFDDVIEATEVSRTPQELEIYKLTAKGQQISKQKNEKPKLLPKNERTNLFFYPDSQFWAENNLTQLKMMGESMAFTTCNQIGVFG